MAIITTRHSDNKVTTQYEGCVIEVRSFNATRNMSDTLDYSDFRTVECTEALVWLGTKSDRVARGDGLITLSLGYRVEPRDLAFHEQFAWVDVSNHFSWRNGETVTAEVDAVMGQSGDPIMWANLIAWRNHVKNVALMKLREAEARAAVIAREAAKKAVAGAARAAKDAAAKSAVEAADMSKVPAKGTAVKVGDFSGKVFWTGTKKYQGKWNVRVGVKNVKGDVVWCGPSDLVRA